MKKLIIIVQIILPLLLGVMLVQCENTCSKWTCVPEENTEITLKFKTNSDFVEVKTKPDSLVSNYGNVYLFKSGTQLKKSNDTLYYWYDNHLQSTGFIMMVESDSRMKLSSFGLQFPAIGGEQYITNYIFECQN
jgi:hypothetical protein